MTRRSDWDPFSELRGVQKRLNQMFESALARSDFDTHDNVNSWSPVCDAYETPQALVLCLELPGLAQEQIDLRLDGDELVVEGERKMDREQAGERYHRVERSFGKFSRRFHLPSHVERNSVRATYRDGVLRVELPSRGARQSETIKVEID